MGKVNGKYGRRFKLRYMLVKRNKKQEWSNMDKKELYEQALMLWGEKLQVGMAIEECSELIVELSKYLRFGLSSAHYGVIEEIADVEIMIEQLKHIFDCDESVESVKKKKLVRLEERITETGPEKQRPKDTKNKMGKLR